MTEHRDYIPEKGDKFKTFLRLNNKEIAGNPMTCTGSDTKEFITHAVDSDDYARDFPHTDFRFERA